MKKKMSKITALLMSATVLFNVNVLAEENSLYVENVENYTYSSGYLDRDDFDSDENYQKYFQTFPYISTLLFHYSSISRIVMKHLCNTFSCHLII